jgi:hypothetical protein
MVADMRQLFDERIGRGARDWSISKHNQRLGLALDLLLARVHAASLLHVP